MRWQYKRLDLEINEVTTPRLEADLERLGLEGWELVTSVQHAKHGYSHRVHLLFKRPLGEGALGQAAE